MKDFVHPYSSQTKGLNHQDKHKLGLVIGWVNDDLLHAFGYVEMYMDEMRRREGDEDDDRYHRWA
jgi:hypothetical protein